MTSLYRTSLKHAFCTALSTAVLLASALAATQLPGDALVACEKPKWRSATEPPKQAEIDAYNACRERSRQAKAALSQKKASGPAASFAPCGETPRTRVSPYGVRTEPTWQEIAAYDACIARLRAQSPAVAVPLPK
jgi:hypothetical protein